MKTALIASLCLGLGTSARALEVHEWGTFTVLTASNGMQAPWYAPSSDLARLPDFILPPMVAKTGFSTIRMETPVIYFYPEKEMKISVDVSLQNGSITETFPHSPGSGMHIDPRTGGMSVDGKWTGTLHPPADKAALAEIPVIKESDNHEPYGAAREVPDAWIFQSDLEEIPGLKVQPHFPQMEKFIFYRGAGDAYIPIQTSMRGDSVSLVNNCAHSLDYAVALRVRDGKAAWIPIPSVAGRPSGDTPAMNRTEITFSKPDRSLDQVESELADAWKKALADDGLTPEEASAMVETWRKTWFRESGDRILTLVPRQTIDDMLPLKITPQPEKTERVFVARIELVSPEIEQKLVGLLNSENKPDEKEFAEFKNLDLGRFGNGALEIATRIQTQRMAGKFYGLVQFGENLKTSER